LTYPRFFRRLLICAAATAALAFFACGPSVQLVYEGNMRFEHCYRLDFDEHIVPTHRRTCWAEWVDNYAKGQTRDRIEYAKRRVESLDRGDAGVLSLHLEDPADAGAPAAVAEPVPIPTSPHAPPPAVSPAAAPSSTATPKENDSGVAGAGNPPADEAKADTVTDKAKRKGGIRSASGRNRGQKPKR
jgi:hypothetical protein